MLFAQRYPFSKQCSFSGFFDLTAKETCHFITIRNISSRSKVAAPGETTLPSKTDNAVQTELILTLSFIPLSSEIKWQLFLLI
jgi:hypothetical protein